MSSEGAAASKFEPSAENGSEASKRDFSNPMYDAMGSMESQAAAEAAVVAAASAAYIPTVDLTTSSSSITNPAASAGSGFFDPNSGSAILTPSSVTQKSEFKGQKRRELDPSSVDTGKDTQCLVTEEGDSEC